MKNIVISEGNYTPPGKLDVEVVERKGLGHPDTLIDGIMESISRKLSHIYLEEFGKIMHHNVDKGVIVGGRTFVEFGGGRVEKPIYILLVGRATDGDGRRIDVNNIAIETAKEYLQNNIPHLNVEKDIEIEAKIRPGSRDLIDLFLRDGVPEANDTSFGVGYAPYTDAENLALNIEKFLNSKDYKKDHPYVGEDIKVMVSRNGEKINLTIALAFISKYINSIDDYIKFKEIVEKDVEKEAKKYTDMEVKIDINTADSYERNSVYITLTGTSAEAGDDGSVGRGNRSNGLITPFRLMTLEAAAGKNPVNHVGKIYSVLSFKIADLIYNELEGDVEDISVTLLSQIGKPISEPKVAFVELVKPGKDYESKARYIVERELENIENITYEIIEGKYPIYY